MAGARTLRWGRRLAFGAAVGLAVVAVVGAVFWPDAMKSNGEGGFFGWGAFAGLYEMLLLTGLAAGWAATKPRPGLRRLLAAFGAATAVVGLFLALQVLLLVVDPHDAHRPELTCSLDDNDLGCHNGLYLAFIWLALLLEALLVQALVCGGLLLLLARGFKRLRERAA